MHLSCVLSWACGGRDALTTDSAGLAVGGNAGTGGAQSSADTAGQSNLGGGGSPGESPGSDAGDLDAGAEQLPIWYQTNAPLRSWVSLAMSSDGTHLITAEGVAGNASYGGTGYIYTSSDSGASWVQTGPLQNWASVASSTDGKTLLAGSLFISYSGLQEQQDPSSIVRSGYLFTSVDSGATWVEKMTESDWYGTAAPANGALLYAVGGGYVAHSSDYGNTWATTDFTAVDKWGELTSIAASSDGTKLVGAEYNLSSGVGYIYTSTSSGWSWTKTGSQQLWSGVASSSDGKKLVAVAGTSQSPGFIYISSDSGMTWTQVGEQQHWTSVASSADGARLIASACGDVTGGLYTSVDSGHTWTQSGNSHCWHSVAISADGKVLAAAGGYIFMARM